MLILVKNLKSNYLHLAIPKGYQSYGLVQEGPDTYVPDTSKFQLMTTGLRQRKYYCYAALQVLVKRL